MRSFSASHPERPYIPPPTGHQRNNSNGTDEEFRRIFRPLEDYIVGCFASFDCVNSSFSAQLRRPSTENRPPVEHLIKRKPIPNTRQQGVSDPATSDSDPRPVLNGPLSETGLLGTGGRPDVLQSTRRPSWKGDGVAPMSTPRSPQLDWAEIGEWYHSVTNTAEPWKRVYDDIARDDSFIPPSHQVLEDLELQLLRAQEHTQRVLLKATEVLLRRPGRPLSHPAELRFLLVIMENPLLHPTTAQFTGRVQSRPWAPDKKAEAVGEAPESARMGGGQHSGIVRRIIGLVSNLSNECQGQLLAWFARYPLSRFTQIKELVSGFLTYRLVRQNEKKPEAEEIDITAGLIPSMAAGRSAASLHAAVGNPSALKKPTERPKTIVYHDDWQIRAAARFMALLFAANNAENVRRGDGQLIPWASEVASREGVHTHGQLLPTSDFYNSLLDLTDLVADFEAWESKRGKLTFCQYPFLLSIWSKSKILEFDAKRQMQSKARDAFFDSIMTRKNINQFLVLEVRRDCLVDDSLKAVSEVIGSGGEDVKKGLRIVFKGEEGVDAGGLRKEWFLLLVREVFNPDHGTARPSSIIQTAASGRRNANPD